jgi:hypothetical protein
LLEPLSAAERRRLSRSLARLADHHARLTRPEVDGRIGADASARG